MNYLLIALGILCSCGDSGAHPDARSRDAPSRDAAQGAPSLRIDRTSAMFGSVTLGATSPPATFTISNAGTAASGAMGIAITGAAAASFTVATTDCAVLAAGATCTIHLAFAPASTGMAQATLAVTADPGGALTAALEGSGTAPGALAISADANTLGDVVVGATSASVATFTVTNTGGAATGQLTVHASGSDPGEFAISVDGCTGTMLSPGAACTIRVAFAPLSTGAKSAAIVASANPGGTVSGAIAGTGLAPAALALSRTSIDLGASAIGQTSTVQTVTVTNPGAVATGALALSLEGTAASDFAIASSDCTTLAAGGTCTIALRVAPSALGSRLAVLDVSATPGGTAMASLAGTGIAAGLLAITPTAQAFDPIGVGQLTAAATFTVANHATVPSGPLAVAVVGAAAEFPIAAGGDLCSGQSLAPQGTCTVAVAFAPASLGNRAATLAISGPGGATSAALSGQGAGPAQLAIAPAGKDFGGVQVGGTSALQSFVVTNTGGLVSGAITASVADAQFAIVGNGCAGPLAPTESCTLAVQFAPAAVGSAQATLEVSAAPGGTVSASLAGVGLVPGSLAIAPSALAFPGITAIGDAAAPLALVVQNGGPVTTGSIALAVTGDFTETSDCSTLAPGATCTVTIRFAPTAAGSRTGQLTVTASPGGSASAALSGIAQPRLEIVALDGGPVDDPHDLGLGIVGAISPPDLVITVRNHTASARPFAIAETYAGQFSTVASSCAPGGQIAGADGDCLVRVRFTPTSAGIKTGSIAFSIGTMPSDTATQDLTGTATDPPPQDHPPTDITLAPNSVAENQPAGTTVGTLSATDPDAGDTFTYALATGSGSADNASFSIAGATLLTTRPFDYETQSAMSIRVRVTDHAGQSFEKALAIQVTDVDDPPTAVADSATTLEDTPVTIAVLANDTDVDGGPMQIASITQPAHGSAAISSTTVIYTPAPDANGSDAFTYTLNGGSTATVTIAITPVNDPPSFTAGPDQTAMEGTAYVTPWATAISAGPPDESTQTVHFTVAVSSGKAGLFAVAPAISPTGVLTYTTQGIPGAATVQVMLSDSGGTANGGRDATSVVTFQILVAGSPPIAVDDAYASIGNVGVTAASPADGVLFHGTPDTVGAGGGVTQIGATSDPQTPVGTPGATAQGGQVNMAADGTFVYDPPAGFQGTDQFYYRVTDANGAAVGTVSIAVSGMIWFFDAAMPPGDGRLHTPYASVAAFANQSAYAGQTLYFARGAYDGVLELLAGQRVIGEGATASLETLSGLVSPSLGTPLPATSGTRPVLANSANTNLLANSVILLSTDNQLRGFDIGDRPFGMGLFGSAFSTLDVREIAIAGSGSGIVIGNGQITGAFDAVSSSSGAIGVSLSAVTTAGVVFDLGGGTIGGQTGKAFSVSSGAGSFRYSGAIQSATVAVNIASKTGGTVELAGPIDGGTVSLTNNIVTAGTTAPIATFTNPHQHLVATGTANALAITGNSNAAFSFVGGGLALESDAGAGLLASAAAATPSSIAIEGAANTIDTNTGTGISLAWIDAGPTGIAFAHVSSAGGVVANIQNSNGSKTLGQVATNVTTGSTAPLLLTAAGVVGIGQLGATSTLAGSVAAPIISFPATTGTTQLNLAGPVQVVQTGNAAGVIANGGTVAIAGGGLAITSTTGTGFAALGTGSISLTGAGNTVAATNGSAITISAAIAAAGVTFQQASSGNAAATGNPNFGIYVMQSAAASGRLAITGIDADQDGKPDPGSGGTIQNTTSDAIAMTSGAGLSLGGMVIRNAGAVGIHLTQLGGTVQIASTTIDTTATHGIFFDGGTVATSTPVTVVLSDNQIDRVDRNDVAAVSAMYLRSPSTTASFTLKNNVIGALAPLFPSVANRIAVTLYSLANGTSRVLLDNNLVIAPLAGGGSVVNLLPLTGGNMQATLTNNFFLDSGTGSNELVIGSTSTGAVCATLHTNSFPNTSNPNIIFASNAGNVTVPQATIQILSNENNGATITGTAIFGQPACQLP